MKNYHFKENITSQSRDKVRTSSSFIEKSNVALFGFKPYIRRAKLLQDEHIKLF